MRNQVTTVPKRRPPSPHSCSKSRSPLRQLAAAKPSQVIKPNTDMKMIRAVQLASCTVFLPPPSALSCEVYVIALVFRRKIHDRGKHSADDHPKQLIPVEERQANP